MELKYLTTFRTIVETGGFTQAAEKLHYTQSTITFQIGQLERELSARLFEKVGRRMVLTEAGRSFIPYADQVLEAVDRLGYFQEELNSCEGELRIGAAETFLCYRLPWALKDVAARAPRARLSIRSMNCYDIRNKLIDGSLDVGLFYRDVGGNLDSLSLQTIETYPVAMLASPGLLEWLSPLDQMGQNYPVPFIINEKDSIFRQIFEGYLTRRGISFGHTVELESIETIKKLVAADVGVSFLPRFTVEEELKAGTLVEIPTQVEHDRITLVLGVHKNKWISPLLQVFLDSLAGRDFR